MSGLFQVLVEVEVLWESIRDFSFKQPTENCLMECSPGHRAAQPTLEAWLPEFFSAPEYIATSVAAESASSISVECDKTKVNVAPVPANELAKLFRFLLHDMATHGKDGGGRIAMTLQDHRLCMSFENVVRGGYHRGRQRSQRLARDLSDHLGVQLELDKQKGEGEVYRARVSIAEVVEI